MLANRLQFPGNPALNEQVTFDVNPANNRLAGYTDSEGTKTTTYDASGNLLTEGTWSYAYDGAGGLETVGSMTGFTARMHWAGESKSPTPTHRHPGLSPEP